MNDTRMTIVGNVVDEPRLRRTRNLHAVTNFRVASTSRRYDREQRQFVDDTTLFVNVTCWRSLAENVFESLRKGQPVVVSGRYYQREYELNEARRIRYELEAVSVGHDLTRGVARFEKTSRGPLTGTVELDGSGQPADDSQEYLDSLDRDEAAAYIDRMTGEIVGAGEIDGSVEAGSTAHMFDEAHAPQLVAS